MPVPLPGRPVRGSQTGRPIMALLDLLGRRWVLRILWELRGGGLGFRELQARCERLSPSVLSQRLQDLQTARLVARDESSDYQLTPQGAALVDALMPLNRWAEHWAQSGARPAAASSPPPAIHSKPKRHSARRSPAN